MRELLLAVASPGTLSGIGFVVLALSLLGEVAVLVVPTERHVLHNVLGLGFAAGVLVGYLIGHIGDDEAFKIVSDRATLAENKLKRFEPRDLTSSQRASVVAAIEQFKGQKYSGSVVQGLDDGCSFWKILYGVLNAAKWAYVPLAQNTFRTCDPPAGIPIASEPGVSILVHSEKAKEIEGAANALASVLTKQGIKTATRTNPYATTNPDEQSTLTIVVGVRTPLP